MARTNASGVSTDDGKILPEDVVFDDALEADDTMETLDLADEPELIATEAEGLDREDPVTDIDNGDNAYNESDAALPDALEEHELLVDPSREGTRFDEGVR